MKQLFLVLPLLLLFSCKDMVKETPPVPGELLEKVILDIHLAEVYSSMLDDSLHQSRNKNLDSLGVYYADIFAHHKITREEFLKGVEWYKQHPTEMDSMYKRIGVKAAVLENTYTK